MEHIELEHIAAREKRGNGEREDSDHRLSQRSSFAQTLLLPSDNDDLFVCRLFVSLRDEPALNSHSL